MQSHNTEEEYVTTKNRKSVRPLTHQVASYAVAQSPAEEKAVFERALLR